MPSANPHASQHGLVQRLLDIIERAGNALPHPATMFAALGLLVVLMSGVFAALDVSVINPAYGETVRAVSLFSVSGLHRILLEGPRNFINFPPLDVALMCLLGIGVAEHSGLMGAVLRLIVQVSPMRWVTAITVLAGVLANAGSEIGYVLVTPLAAAGRVACSGQHRRCSRRASRV